jgi:hypothetical protein
MRGGLTLKLTRTWTGCCSSILSLVTSKGSTRVSGTLFTGTVGPWQTPWGQISEGTSVSENSHTVGSSTICKFSFSIFVSVTFEIIFFFGNLQYVMRHLPGTGVRLHRKNVFVFLLLMWT